MPRITIDDLHPIVADRLKVPLDQLKGEFDSAIIKVADRRGILRDPNRPPPSEIIWFCLTEACDIVADRLNVLPDQLKGEFCTALAEWFGRVTENI